MWQYLTTLLLRGKNTLTFSSRRWPIYHRINRSITSGFNYTYGYIYYLCGVHNTENLPAYFVIWEAQLSPSAMLGGQAGADKPVFTEKIGWGNQPISGRTQIHGRWVCTSIQMRGEFYAVDIYHACSTTSFLLSPNSCVRIVSWLWAVASGRNMFFQCHCSENTTLV